MIKTICITGATSGIGEATAKIFAQHYNRIIITGRRKERLDELSKRLQAKYGIEIISLNFDVRSAVEVENAFDSLPSEWKDIDVLVNNAGLAVGLSPIQEGVLDDWERMIDTNIKGLLYVTRKVLPIMIKNKRGHIINIGSIAGKETYLNGNVYCATKHAVDSLSKAIRMDSVNYGIKVTQIAPGAAETEFSIVRFKGDKNRADNVYTGFQPLTGEDIANVIYYATTLPEHVNINDLVIMPTAQASATITHKE